MHAPSSPTFPPSGIVARLREAYGEKEAMDRNDSAISRFVYRPISFYLAVPFVRAGMSPNQVTLLGAAVAGVGVILLATGSRQAVIWGSVLCVLQVLLDYVDGNIARLRKTGSHLGKFVDGVVDTFVTSLVPVGIGIGLLAYPDRILSLFPRGYADRITLILTVGASLTIALQAALTYRLRAAVWEAGRRGTDGAEGAAAYGHGLRRSVKIANTLLRTEAYAMIGLIPFFALANALSLYLLIRFMARGSALIVELGRTMSVASRSLSAPRSY